MKPDVRISWAPGRVNLIGEHIDYHGLPVLPMALRRGVRIAFRAREDHQVVLSNADPEFPDRTFVLERGLTPGPLGDWGNYLKAGALTVLERYGADRGIDGEVSSDLPPAAGLSSSSALVVAVAKALLDASALQADRLELADVLAKGERFVGTAGGGMDQAASLSGVAGCAIRIAFDPLTVEQVPFPREWRRPSDAACRGPGAQGTHRGPCFPSSQRSGSGVGHARPGPPPTSRPGS